jgi:hypothetical protein
MKNGEDAGSNPATTFNVEIAQKKNFFRLSPFQKIERCRKQELLRIVVNG